MRTQMELDNAAAAELAGVGDTTLRSLRGQLGVELILRGNLLTIDGDDEAVLAAEAVVRELSELVEHGHELIPATVDAVSDALHQHEDPAAILDDVVWRSRALKVAPKTVHQKRYVDSVRRSTMALKVSASRGST